MGTTLALEPVQVVGDIKRPRIDDITMVCARLVSHNTARTNLRDDGGYKVRVGWHPVLQKA